MRRGGVAAGVCAKASSQGRASETPAARRKLRRVKNFLAMLAFPLVWRHSKTSLMPVRNFDDSLRQFSNDDCQVATSMIEAIARPVMKYPQSANGRCFF